MNNGATIPPARRVTADDVAREARVSRVAVSRAFTAGASVSPRTRDKVVAAAEKLGYQPNILARNLNKQSSDLIALVAGYQENLYDARYLDRLLHALQSDAHYVLHAHVDGSSDVEAIIARLLNYPLAAVVVAAGSITQRSVDKCLKLNAPIVLGGQTPSIPGVDSVICDNGGGIRAAVDHLLDRGRRHIVCLTGPRALFSSAERSAAFAACCRERQLSSSDIVETAFTFDGGYQAARALLTGRDRPDALLCTNDAIALGALSAARDELGLALPEDVAIIGFDDVPQAAWPCFRLTTVRNPLEQRVTEIARLVKRRIDHRAAPFLHRVLQAELVVRQTT